jgi:hypothetical protein
MIKRLVFEKHEQRKWHTGREKKRARANSFGLENVLRLIAREIDIMWISF